MYLKFANKIFLLLDQYQLCPHACVERVMDFLGLANSKHFQFLYDWGLAMCNQACIWLPDDED